MTTHTYFCSQLERRVNAEEFEAAKKIYMENVTTPKISIDWKIYQIDADLIDEVFYYAVKFGYEPSIYEDGNQIPRRAIRKYREKIAQRIADFVITSDSAETYTSEDYKQKLGIKEESVGDYDKMMKEAIKYIVTKYKGNDVGLLDKEVKLYGNSVMSTEYRKDTPKEVYTSGEEYMKGKK